MHVSFLNAPHVSLLGNSSLAQLEFWAVVGAVAGVCLFFQGFRMFRLKRLILNTPLSKVRSASMGLVEISGTAQGPHTIPAGISGDPCFLYQARAWKLRGEGKDRSWDLVADETQFIPFYLEDATGRMLIDPRGAELDLPRNFWDDLSSSFFGNSPLIPQGSIPFLARYNLIAADSVRLEEFCIRPGRNIFVLGTLGHNTLEKDWKPRPFRSPTTCTKGISLAQALDWIPGGLSAALPFSATKTFTAGTIKVPLGDRRVPGVVSFAQPTPHAAPLPEPAAPKSNWTSISMDEAAWRHGAAQTASSKQNPLDGRSTAVWAPTAPAPSAVSPGHSQVAVAAPPSQERALDPLADLAHKSTPEEIDPDDFDLTTPVAVGNGNDENPFTLSSHSQREVVRALEWKSVLFIFGGPVLTVCCLWFLAAASGWIK